MSVQDIFNEISLTKDESIWESAEDSNAWNRKRIKFLSEFKECLFEKILSKETSTARKNVKLSGALLMKAQKTQETSAKLKLLSQALMFCPPGEVMDQVLRVRARIFYNIDKISYCHEDIKSIKKRNEDDEKLLHYQANGSSDTNKDQESLLTEPNKKYKNFTSKIEVNSARNKGRFVIATEDIKPGELIAEENSIIGVADAKFSRDHCDNCLISLDDYCLPCSQCSSVAFCSKLCRDQAKHHSVECLLLDQIYRADTGAWHLALRLIASKPAQFWNTAEYKQENQDSYASSEMSSAFHLVTHDDTADREAPILMKECMTALYFLRILQADNYFNNKGKKSQTELSKEELNICMLLLHFMRVVFYNCHEVTEYIDQDVIRRIGVCLNPSLALINHSCDSNYARVVKGRKSLAFATRLIKKGAPIYDSYSPTFFLAPRAERLEVTERYNFNCGCEACVENWPTQEKMSNVCKQMCTSKLNDIEFADLKDNLQEILSTEENISVETIVELLLKCYDNIQHPDKLVLLLETKLHSTLWKVHST